MSKAFFLIVLQATLLLSNKAFAALPPSNTPLQLKPYVQLSSSVTQSPAPITGSLVISDTVNTISNFEVSSKKDCITCKVPGLYFFSCSMQPAALKEGTFGYLDAWFELNGKPIGDSTTRQYVTATSPITLMTIPFLIQLNEGDVMGTKISASGPDIGIIYIQNPNNEPDITSYIVSIFKVDTLPSTPYAQFTSSVTQTPVPEVGSLVTMDITNAINNFELSTTKDRVICKIPGLYFFSCAMQPSALKRGIAGYLDCWFELNNKAIPTSTTRQYITEDSPVGLMTVPFLIELKEGDSVGARMCASGPDIGILYVQNPHNEPDVTSYAISMFKIDQTDVLSSVSKNEKTPVSITPYVQLTSSATQLPVSHTGSLVLADSVNLMNNFEISPHKDGVICHSKGLYFLSCAMQPAALKKGVTGFLDCWFELNNKPIAASTTRQYVTEDSPIGLMTIPFLIELQEGDIVSTKICASGPDIGIIYLHNPNNEPDITSYIISIFKVD